MATATERIPVLVTKGDKSRFRKKAKSYGFSSISEFARTAMARFSPDTQQEEEAFDALLVKVKEGTRIAEHAIDHTIARCDASNARMAQLETWMKERGYT
jgi:hypothetical protein